MSNFTKEEYNYVKDILKIRDFQSGLPFSGKVEINEDNIVENAEFDMLDPKQLKKTEGMDALDQIKYLSASNVICNSEAFCRIAEDGLGIKISENTEKIRILFNEIERINSHLFVLANMAEAMNIDILKSELLRQREKIARFYEKIFGTRVFPKINVIGGVTQCNRNSLRIIAALIHDIDEYFKGIENVFFTDKALITVLKDIGILEESNARILGLTGPIAKASNIIDDIRTEVYAKYLPEFKVVRYNNGDCYSRALVRVQEISQSIDIIFDLLDTIGEPDEIELVTLERTMEGLLKYEQPEGEAIMHIKSDEDGQIINFSLKTQKENAKRAMRSVILGSDFNDIPVIMSSFNFCDYGVDI